MKKAKLLQKLIQKKQAMSIQSRIFMYFLLFTALLLMLLWLFQIVFLDTFYRLQKVGTVKKVAASITHNIDHAEAETLIQQLAEKNNLCVLVTDEAMNKVYSADSAFGCVIHHLNSRDLRRMTDRLDTGVDAFHFFPMQGFRQKDFDNSQFNGPVPLPKQEDSKSLVYVQRVTLPEGGCRYLFLNTLVTPVTSTVDTLRAELLVITAILVLLSFLLSSVLSRRISRPIVKTTEAARALSKGEYEPIHTKVNYKEIAELNGQLSQAAKDLHRVEEMQRELIANISHDLRTPLTLIEGYVEVMQDIPGENTPENLQTILDETKRLSTLVNTVLDYSKSRSDDMTIKWERFNLTEAIRQIIQRYGKLTKQDGYRIVFEQDRDVFVRADALKVSQVIYNLTNNALTYTGEDRTVTITQRVTEHIVKIEIKDSGEGIEPEELPYIWTRYYRGKKPHKRPAVGSGLGLNIVQGILEKHGMSYGVESEKNKGSTFWFALPESTDEEREG